jgi:hypothetical protein
MPAQRTPRREALAGAGTTASLLAATIGGALVVAGLLGAGAFPVGPDDGSSDPLRIASPPAHERTVSIVLPRAPRAHRRAAATQPAGRRPRGVAPRAPSRPTATHSATPAPTASAPATKATPQSPPAPPATEPPGTPAPGGPLAPAADAAREATATAAGTVHPASPPLASAAGAAGDAAAKVVDDAGDVVATLTGPGR